MLFAIEAVLDIAYNASSEPVQSSDISRRQEIPKRYLEQALQQLVRNNILIGIRGPRGGYRLARERRRISVGDIVRVVRALESSDDPITDAAGSELGTKVVRPLWLEMQTDVMDRLDAITIDDLCDKAVEAEIDTKAASHNDWQKGSPETAAQSRQYTPTPPTNTPTQAYAPLCACGNAPPHNPKTNQCQPRPEASIQG